MVKLMNLGGSRYAVPLINIAHQLGIYVITVDYIPDNIAHKYYDEYVNVNIIEKDKALGLTQERREGIVLFVGEIGVFFVGYMAENKGISFQRSYYMKCTLHDNGLFCKFLTDLVESKGEKRVDKRYTEGWCVA